MIDLVTLTIAGLVIAGIWGGFAQHEHTNLASGGALGADSVAQVQVANAAIGTGELKTATGSASLTTSATGDGVTTSQSVDVTLNDYAFFPGWTVTEGGTGGSSEHRLRPQSLADPGTPTGKLNLYSLVSTSSGGGFDWAATQTLRWRYITASDNPEIWVAVHPVTGEIAAVWVADDPTPNGVPGVSVPGHRSVKLTASDLSPLPLSVESLALADTVIVNRKLNPAHRLYRALQSTANDAAPSRWILAHCAIDRDGRLTMKTGKQTTIDFPAARPLEPIPSAGLLARTWERVTSFFA